MYIELLVLLNILADGIKKDHTQEQLGLRGLHIRDEDLGGGPTRVRGPIFGMGECEHTCPCWEGGYNLEDLRKGAGLVFLKE